MSILACVLDISDIQYVRTTKRTTRRRRAFTLIETALTVVIIGLGVVSMLQLIAAGTVSNVEGAQLTTAVNLARNVREYTLQRTFAQVQAINGTTYSTPIDSRGQAISGMTGWTQTVTVEVADPNNLPATIVDATPDVIRVKVSVKKDSAQVNEMTWYRFAASGS